MTMRARGPVLRAPAAALVVAAAGALAACGGGSASAPDGVLDPSEWIAAELASVPDGYSVVAAREDSTFGRVISYRGAGAADDIEVAPQISVTASVPMDRSVDELLAEPGSSADAASGIAGQVAGHRAVVRPLSADGTTPGWEAVWEPAPGLQVRVVDARTATRGDLEAGAASVVALAEQVEGLDREEWGRIRDRHQGSGWDGASLPPGAVEREVADGVLDGRQWTLSVRGPADEGQGMGSCFRLSYAGEDTGEGCSVERVVLAGKGFVLGWIGGGDDPGELVAGPGSSFDPIEPQVHAYGRDDEQHVSIAVLPDGACGVVRVPRAGMVPRPLDLLPGDDGALECSTR